jgi:hypothetical protein
MGNRNRKWRISKWEYGVFFFFSHCCLIQFNHQKDYFFCNCWFLSKSWLKMDLLQCSFLC